MRIKIALAAYFAFMSTALAQPVSATGECRFYQPGQDSIACRATFNFRDFQSPYDASMSVICEGPGQDETPVFNGDVELNTLDNNLMSIDPDGPRTTPAIIIPNDSFTCGETSRWVNATLNLRFKRFSGECLTFPNCSH